MTFQRLPQVPPMELPENLKETFALLEAQGLKPDPTALINKWVTRKQVLRDAERGIYVKQ